ncbi:DgyrCDS11096 [Dimorphilus gyrociliatus]|uniref:DgyrCDS11096 n=1 Tax=Dimorphilus gyrociliatus TaxID=2664684 RepID=A0A7I8W2A5_9ANNE|nr:DgyrCDS11096 [Dimorphilus gyrociliatus]
MGLFKHVEQPIVNLINSYGVKNEIEKFLVVADIGLESVWQFSLDGRKYTLKKNLSSPVAVDISSISKTIFVADSASNAIYSAPFYESNSETLFKDIQLESKISGLTVDSSAGLLFYTILLQKSISVIDISTKKEKVIVSDDSSGPKSIRCDPVNRKIYWIGIHKPIIRSSDYDGANILDVVHGETGDIWTSLFLDTRNRIIYFTSAKQDKIFTASLDHLNQPPKVFHTIADGSDISGIAVDDTYFYFADKERDTIMRGQLNRNFSSPFMVQKKLLTPSDIQIYIDSYHDKDVQSLCSINNGNCSEICITKIDSIKCLCSGEKRVVNKVNCTKEKHYEGPKLITVTFDGKSTSTIYTSRYFDKKGTRFIEWDFQAITYDYGRSTMYLIDRDYKYVFWTDWGVSKSIERGNLGGTNRMIIASFQKNIAALTLDYQKNRLYYAVENKIYSIDMNGKNQQSHTTVSDQPIISLAYSDMYIIAAQKDFKGEGKILFYNRSNFTIKGALKINEITSMILYDKEFQKPNQIIIDFPRFIVVDDRHGKLYWTEGGILGNGKIFRANLDGSLKELFRQSDTEYIAGLAFDSDRLYWTNNKNIFSVTIDNFNLANFSFSIDDPKNIAVYRDYVAVNQKSKAALTMGALPEYNTLAFKPKTVAHSQYMNLTGLIAFHRQYSTNEFRDEQAKCNYKKCEQFCFYFNESPKCSCVDGMKLKNNGRSCEPEVISETNFFLIADDYKHQIYKVDYEMKKFSTFLMPKDSRPIGVDFDMIHKKIYWSEFGDGKKELIYRSDLKGENVETVFSLTHNESETFRIDSLAIDPHARLLYYTDQGIYKNGSRKSFVGVLHLDTLEHKKNLLEMSGRARSIALYPEKGYIYLTERGTKPNETAINRAFMDGSEITKLSNKLGTTWPMGVALNRQSDELFWCDAHTEIFYKTKLDFEGNTTKVFHTKASHDPFDVEIQGDYLYWTDWKAQGLRRINIKSPNKKEEIFFENIFYGLNEIKFYNSTEIEARGKIHPCKNHYCSDFCFSHGNSYRCGCRDGSQLRSDGRTCENKCPKVKFDGTLNKDCTFLALSKCSFKCVKTHYSIIREAKVDCLSTSTWSLDLKKSFCPNVKEDKSITKVSCENYTDGSVCQLRCKDGLELQLGNLSRTCSLGSWTGQNPICKTNHNFGIIIGVITACVLVAVISLFLGIMVLRRKLARKSIPYGQQIDEPNVNSDSVPSTSYNVKTEEINLDNNLAFGNPLYETIQQPNEMKIELGQEEKQA